MNARLLFLITVSALFFGCAHNPPGCGEALKLREQAKNAPLEQRAVLEAQAQGLEDACAREREKLWEKNRGQRAREEDMKRK